MASEAGSASGSGSFGDFWQRTGKKFKFVPGNSGGEGGQGGNDQEEDIATAALSTKQKRRAQVRKAQKEHRERKANYAKHLEKDIIDLRNLISTAESQALQTQQENNAVRRALLQAQIPISLPQQPLKNTQTSDLGQSVTFDPQAPLEPPPLNINHDSLNWQDNMHWVPDDGSMVVSTFFDEELRKTILRVSPKEDRSKGGEEEGIDMTGFDAFLDNVLKEIDSEADSISQATKQSLGPQSTKPQATKPVKKEADFSTTAVNFILALEHPCRTHFHAPESSFDPLGDPSGHELLASTLLYNSAPLPVFPALTAAVPVPSFTHSSSSSATLQTLKEMSQSLPKGDLEITPVQAWFMLVEKYGTKLLVEEGRIERLRKALSELVDCFAFGAVMVEGKFWDAVKRVFVDVALREEREEVRDWI